MDWQRVLSRLSIPGLILLVAGVVIGAQAARLCATAGFQERAALWIRLIGLALALLGAVILLDFIPGL